MAKGLFDNDASVAAAARTPKLFHHGLEKRGRDSQIMRRAFRGAEFLADRLKGCRGLVVSAYVAQ